MLGMVIGTRPEWIKLLPIYRMLHERSIPTRILFTAQHSAIHPLVAKELGVIGIPDHVDVLGLASNFRRTGHGDVAMKAMIVQGDTKSAVAGALSAAYDRIPVIHVEAGLRSYAAEPYPEELNRTLISRVASLHLAPTMQNLRNLRAEGCHNRAVVTGNPGITVVEEWLQFTGIKPKERTIVVTCHRRENWSRIKVLIDELLALATKLKNRHSVQFILHPNPSLRATAVRYLADAPHDGGAGIYVQDALDHGEMLQEIQEAALVVTDSGGIIEEATYLGKRLCVLRAETERPEANGLYTAIQLGCHETMLRALEHRASDDNRLAFGGSDSAKNCTDEIEAFYKELTKA